MRWTEGHVWKAFAYISELPQTFDYKYVIEDSNTWEVIQWEKGENREFSLTAIENEILNTQNESLIRNLDPCRIRIGAVNTVYVKEKKHLIVLDKWR